LWSALHAFLFIRRHVVKTELSPWTWHDCDEVLLYAMMAILVEYVEREMPHGWTDWNNDDESRKAKSEIDAIYAWWKSYPSREAEIRVATAKWHDASEAGENDRALFDRLHGLEDKLYAETEEMMVRLVKVKDWIWE